MRRRHPKPENPEPGNVYPDQRAAAGSRTFLPNEPGDIRHLPYANGSVSANVGHLTWSCDQSRDSVAEAATAALRQLLAGAIPIDDVSIGEGDAGLVIEVSIGPFPDSGMRGRLVVAPTPPTPGQSGGAVAPGTRSFLYSETFSPQAGER
ncbi:hypothetical protein [Gordonia caeni]|uniref:Uncharacterized protein n=1 Tax=Gordonia caeni TaxID=1007097 RepID=A0ABP7NSN3_9ACTN